MVLISPPFEFSGLNMKSFFVAVLSLRSPDCLCLLPSKLSVGFFAGTVLYNPLSAFPLPNLQSDKLIISLAVKMYWREKSKTGPPRSKIKLNAINIIGK